MNHAHPCGILSIPVFLVACKDAYPVAEAISDPYPQHLASSTVIWIPAVELSSTGAFLSLLPVWTVVHVCKIDAETQKPDLEVFPLLVRLSVTNAYASLEDLDAATQGPNEGLGDP